MFINKYDPRLKKNEELEKTFVCGENILTELLDNLKPGTNKRLSDQSWIITGPRGSGKSHLLVLLYRKIRVDKTLSTYWFPLSFPEELFDVDSLYRLLLRILENLFDSTDDVEKLTEARTQFLELKKIKIKGNLKQKKGERHRVARELLNLLARVREMTGRKLILMLENLQHLFRDQLPEDDLKMLRGFMNEKPDVFIIMGTALAVFDQIENYGKPFYHFFRLRSLDSLDRHGILDFLIKTAEFRGDRDIPQKAETNRHYIYVYRLLTGGNPRLILFLYELLLDNERLDTEMILAKITELTPYFLDKTRDESSQRKLILDALATESPAQTATEIAEYINEEQKSISEQLKRLEAEGWVKEINIEAEGVKHKEVFYTLRDYFYRIWYKVRMKGIDESDIYCMAELAAIIFDRRELEERALKYTNRVSEKRILYEKSLELSLNEKFMRNIMILLKESKQSEKKEILDLIDEGISCFDNKYWEKLIDIAEKMTSYPKIRMLGYGLAWIGCSAINNYTDSYEQFSQYIKYVPEFIGLDYLNIYKLKKIAGSIFKSGEEMQKLIEKKSSLKVKMEALCRLLLLDKFADTTEPLNLLLKMKELPEYESKKLDSLLEGYILYILVLTGGKGSGRLKILIKYWIRLIDKISTSRIIRKKILRFVYHYIVISGKKNVSLEIIEEIVGQLSIEGIDISDVIIEILRAVKKPHTREAQKWMADPLFAEIVKQLSQG